jgi:hypothetical protein
MAALVLTQAEVQRLLTAMTGRHALLTRRLDGGGLRLLEGLLRIQDVDCTVAMNLHRCTIGNFSLWG